MSVTALLDAYNKHTDVTTAAAAASSSSQRGGGVRAEALFCSSLSSGDLLGHVHESQRALVLLQNTSALWRAQRDAAAAQSELVEELFGRLVTALKKLSNQLVLFLQVSSQSCVCNMSTVVGA